MIGGWRLFGAAIVIGIILLRQAFGWLCGSIYRVGVVNTAIALFWKAGEFPDHHSPRRADSGGPSSLRLAACNIISLPITNSGMCMSNRFFEQTNGSLARG
jgi:hypothetical protein